MPNRSESFGRFLKAGIGSIAMCEGKKASIIEEDLGQQIGVTGDTIQRYKSGYLPPDNQSVRILAEACVRRGFLGREWLHRFLRAAQYPAPERLLDDLCPHGVMRPRIERTYKNLPAPTYNHFVMRPQAFEDVADGLRQRSAAVVIVGLGGNGKTSLAREVAALCLKDTNEIPRFDAAVWASDKDFPGTTNLSTVLDTIARTLDYPGFIQFPHDEKQYEVEQLLHRQRVLLIVDNAETITDTALLVWLMRLPEPSKAIITTREYRREFRRGGWLVELRGMTNSEMRELVQERLRVLKITELISEYEQLDPLMVATGGNPKAITMTLGLFKYERRSLQQVIDDLYTARGDLFTDLFTRTWALLDEAARQVLLTMPLFATSASDDAIASVADINGFTLDRALSALSDLSLIDVRQSDLITRPRYVLHPLVRAFARSKLLERPRLEADLRERWVYWYIDLVSQVGYCWNDLGRLDVLDPELGTIEAVIAWTRQTGHHAETLKMFKGVGYYYYVRGLWDRNPPINLIGAKAAQSLTELAEEAEATAYHIQVLSKQGVVADVEPFIARLEEIIQQTRLSAAAFFELQHAIALYAMARQDTQSALSVWQQMLDVSAELDVRAYIANRRWLATCLYHQGLTEEAQHLLKETLHDAMRHQYTRGVVSIQTKLANMYLDQNDLDTAADALDSAQTYALHYQERRHTAELRRTFARLYALRGDFSAAITSLTEAIDLFERIGMRRELAEAREELTRLELLLDSAAEADKE